MLDLDDLSAALRARPADGVVNLAGYDPAATPFADSDVDVEDLHDELFDAHELMFAEADASMLLILQGVDSSGKNGTIKHVVIAMNPAGVRTASFTEPTEQEAAEHFLDRYRRELPKPGQLGVFDRSYYEDVLVPSAHGTLPPENIDHRIEQINEFEADLVDRGTVVVKCLLHISYDEQRDRFLRRLRRDDKRWKFADSDLDSRRRWDEVQAAYGDVVARTSADAAPWYVIPADHKWYRNWIVGQLLLAEFDALGCAYPQPDLDLEDLRARLAPPN